MSILGVDLLFVEVVFPCRVVAGGWFGLVNQQPVVLCSSPEELDWLEPFCRFMFLQQAMACFRFSPIFLVRMTSAFMLFTAVLASPFDSGL